MLQQGQRVRFWLTKASLPGEARPLFARAVFDAWLVAEDLAGYWVGGEVVETPGAAEALPAVLLKREYVAAMAVLEAPAAMPARRGIGFRE